jgi:hypothetical protein
MTSDPAVSVAVELMISLGAEPIEHPGGTLLAHLRRVHDLTVAWAASRSVQLAALCHATYGTDGFRQSLLPVDERQRLRAAIGADAESLVYVYDACDRGLTYAEIGRDPLPATDRFTGEIVGLQGAELVDFAVLTIANELDVVRFADLPDATVAEIRSLIEALAAYAPEAAARALVDPVLT